MNINVKKCQCTTLVPILNISLEFRRAANKSIIDQHAACPEVSNWCTLTQKKEQSHIPIRIVPFYSCNSLFLRTRALPTNSWMMSSTLRLCGLSNQKYFVSVPFLTSNQLASTCISSPTCIYLHINALPSFL